MSDLFLEVWTRPGDPNFGRVLDDVPFASSWLSKGLNRIGEGNMVVPDSFPNFDDLLKTDSDTPSNSKSSLVRVFSALDPTTPIHEWLPNEILPSASKGSVTTRVTGVGFNGVLGYGRLEAFDWDGSDDWSPIDADWQFGGGQNLLQNPSFEFEPMPNGGFELGNANYWAATENEGIFNPASLSVINSPVDARSGDWYGLMNPNGATSGAERTITNLVPGETYTIVGYGKDIDGTGDRYRAGVSGAATATHTNAYEADGFWWAEIGNAAMGGGSSDGTYQSFTLTFVASETTVQLVVVYESSNNHNLAIDDWNISGDNVGIVGWEQYNPSTATITKYEYSTTQAQDGVSSLVLSGSTSVYTSPFGRSNYPGIGTSQNVATTIGKTYTGSVWVRHDGAGNEPFSLIFARVTPKGNLGTTLTGSQLPVHGSYWMSSVSVQVAPNTWTKITLTDVADVGEIRFDVRWRGSLATSGGTVNSPANVWFDNARMYEGLPATTVGDILNQIYDHATNPNLRSPIVWDDGSATDTPYLVPDFDDVNDSAGQPWDEPEIATRLTMRMSYSQIMAKFAKEYRYEYRIVPNDVEAGTWLWQVYNPGTMSVDHTGAATPAIQGGSTDVARGLRRVSPSGTDQMVEGVGRVTSRARNTDLMTALGRIEASALVRELPDLVATAVGAASAVDSSLEGLESITYTLVDPDDEPISAYDVGDLVTIVDPPEVDDVDRRCVEISATITPQSTEWETQWGSATIIDPDAAVADAVAGLLTKFDYPDPEFQGFAGLGGDGAGGAFTVQVAAADASGLSKEKADFVCTGTNDETVIQAAVDLCTAGGGGIAGFGGRVEFSEGTYNIGANGVIGPGSNQSITFKGIGGYATRFQTSDTTGAIITAGLGTEVDGIFFVGTGFTGPTAISGTGTSDQVRVRGCLFSNLAIACDVTGDEWIIEGNREGTSLAKFVKVANGIDHTIVIGNVLASSAAVDMGQSQDWLVAGNILSGAVLFEENGSPTGEGCNIVGNYFWTADAFNNAIIEGSSAGASNPGRINIVGNQITTGDYAIWVSDAVDVHIADNTISGAFGSIRLVDCVGGEVANNVSLDDTNNDATDAAILLDGCSEISVSDNKVRDSVSHGIRLTASSDCHLSDNTIIRPGQDADNTYDGILLDGDSDNNYLHGNKIIGVASSPQPRYGINISASTCDCNIVVGNSLGDPANYGSDALNDAGTDTQLFYPADATYGDNFTGCSTSS